jgi:hypothetical protein
MPLKPHDFIITFVVNTTYQMHVEAIDANAAADNFCDIVSIKDVIEGSKMIGQPEMDDDSIEIHPVYK